MPQRLSRYLPLIIGCLLIVLSSSCKSAKQLTADGLPNTKLSSKQLIKLHNKQSASFETLQAKLKIEITQQGKSQGVAFSMRMKKDEIIWLSATLGLARLKITPDRVQYYSKIDNEFFDGDYALLSDFAGVDLDFNKVQNLLLGQAIYDLSKESHELSVNESSYILKPEESNALLDILYLINPGHFKLDALELYQPTVRRMLQVDFESYQTIDEQVLPKQIRIVAVDQSDEASIDIDYKSVTLNKELRYPFKIPAGYTEIQIK